MNRARQSGSHTRLARTNTFVHASHARGVKNGVRRGAVIETRDVFRDRAIKQRHVLRQITDVSPEFVWIPIA